tara:strand:- start:3882 stop:5288 length:1407 start_codon:yes stop_codon:yes gene_type:complete
MVKKKKILLMSDDLRIPSGVGTMSKSLVTGTVQKYDWCQIGGAVNHPEAGKVFDLSEELNKSQNISDAYCKIYPVNGYGNEELLREIIAIEKPDGILHFTDPRFWGFLYNMEHELRQTTPIMYYNIWDDLPYPHWNENFYESCDLLMAISKQTYNINKHVSKRKPRVEGVDLTYVPHGIDEKKFLPVDKQAEELTKFKSDIVRGKDINFIALFNSRNIHRKRPSDLMLGYKMFCDSLSKEEAAKVLLIMHTDPIDDAGTDLPTLSNALLGECNVGFSTQKLDEKQLNYLYNIADVTCNPSSAEGFGLSHMESLMSGTPTIVTVVGGLQDQIGFKVDGEEITVKHFTEDIPSNSTGKISKEHGEWAYPLWPQLNLQGSPQTPYIYDSRPSIESICEGLKYWYNMTKEERETRGKAGREWAITNGFTKKNMCDQAMLSIDKCFETFKPRGKYTLIDTSIESPIIKKGILI